MYNKISIKNLRGINYLEVDNLGQINLIVGDNNCGKTTFLEGIFYLIGATNPMLPLRTNTFRGLEYTNDDLWLSFFNNMQIESPIKIVGSDNNTGKDESLSITPFFDNSSKKDLVNSDSNNGDSLQKESPSGLNFGFSDFSKPDEIITTVAKRVDNKIATEGAKDFKRREKKGIFVCQNTRFDWKNRFDSIQRKRLVPKLVNCLKEIEPDIEDIRLNVMNTLEADAGLPKLIPLNLMGGGIATYISVALAMLDYADGVVLIDEIENGLHYSVQEKLWKAIFSWAQELHTQVFATTHSYENIKAFHSASKESLFRDQSKLIRLERKENAYKAVEIPQDELGVTIDEQWEVR